MSAAIEYVYPIATHAVRCESTGCGAPSAYLVERKGGFRERLCALHKDEALASCLTLTAAP